MRIVKKENETRKEYLLRVAATYILEYAPDDLVVYDEAACDGACLVDDICDELLIFPEEILEEAHAEQG